MNNWYLLHDTINIPGVNILRLKDISYPKLFFELPFKKLESVDYFLIKGVLEIASNIRHILRNIDYSLKVSGILEVYFYSDKFDAGGGVFRSYSYILNEIGLVLADRYTMIFNQTLGGVTHLKYIKDISFFPDNDEGNSWSFGLVTSGNDQAVILKNVQLIKSFNIPKYEILVCCPKGIIDEEGFRILDDRCLWTDDRIPVSAKKNLIAKEAKFNNLIIFHDRIIFSDFFYRELAKLLSAYDVVCFPIFDIESKTRRLIDWVALAWDTNDYKKSKSILLPYTYWSPEIYLNGGLLCIKRHFYLDVLQNTNLHWGEMEDVDFSRRLFLKGLNFTFYDKPIVYSTTVRFGRVEKPNPLRFWLNFIFGPYAKVKNYILIKRRFFVFLKNANFVK